MGFVDLNGVTYVLPDGRVLLDGVTFRVGEGSKSALVGANGAGKTTLLRILQGVVSPHSGAVAVDGGLGVMPQFVGEVRDQTTVAELLVSVSPPPLRAACAELDSADAADQRFETLSGGQQARFQILLLELAGATLLLLDEPTDNLDLHSAEALETGLDGFEGTVVAVTHDRWFARGFDRYLVFGANGQVYESDDPVWDEDRVARAR